MIETDVQVGEFNLKDKTDFELCREFTLWDPQEDAALLKEICRALKRRHPQRPLVRFALIALMNNCILLFIEAIYNDRCDYFEDSAGDVRRQALLSITFLFLPTLIVGTLIYLRNRSITAVTVMGLLWISVFIFIGLIKTINDIKIFIRLDKSSMKK